MGSQVLDLERVSILDGEVLEQRIPVVEDLLVRGCEPLAVYAELNGSRVSVLGFLLG